MLLAFQDSKGRGSGFCCPVLRRELWRLLPMAMVGTLWYALCTVPVKKSPSLFLCIF